MSQHWLEVTDYLPLSQATTRGPVAAFGLLLDNTTLSAEPGRAVAWIHSRYCLQKPLVLPKKAPRQPSFQALASSVRAGINTGLPV